MIRRRIKISQKSLGWWLIFSGLICFIVSLVVYDLLIIIWSTLLAFSWVIILLCLAGMVSIIVGGMKLKYNVTSWIVLSGVLMIMASLLLASLIMSLGGILSSYASVPAIFIIIGLGCIVVGALIDEK